MKTMLTIGVVGLAVMFNGGLMGEQGEDWVKVKDHVTGLQAEFPRPPLEMTFELPFHKSFPGGTVHFYSVPTSTGVLVLSTLRSSALTVEWLSEEHLKQYFDKVLVPHLYYHPQIFHDHQTFNYTRRELSGRHAADFHVSYLDHESLKELEGTAFIDEGVLFTYFYLASEKDFDRTLLRHFIDSIRL